LAVDRKYNLARAGKLKYLQQVKRSATKWQWNS